MHSARKVAQIEGEIDEIIFHEGGLAEYVLEEMLCSNVIALCLSPSHLPSIDAAAAACGAVFPSKVLMSDWGVSSISAAPEDSCRSFDVAALSFQGGFGLRVSLEPAVAVPELEVRPSYCYPLSL